MRLHSDTSLVLFHPLQIVLCITFLYQVLGLRCVILSSPGNGFRNLNSSFVGLAVILMMAPIPVFLAKLIQKVQIERMKMVIPVQFAIPKLCAYLHERPTPGCKQLLRVRKPAYSRESEH